MRFSIETQGRYDFVDLTHRVIQVVDDSTVSEGLVNVFVRGSTVAVTTMEFEPGLVKDLTELFERWAPEQDDYHHNQKWGDHNGAAHIKSSILGTDLSIPIEDGKALLGTWQHIVLIDFDERPREREIVVTVVPSIQNG